VEVLPKLRSDGTKQTITYYTTWQIVHNYGSLAWAPTCTVKHIKMCAERPVKCKHQPNILNLKLKITLLLSHKSTIFYLYIVWLTIFLMGVMNSCLKSRCYLIIIHLRSIWITFHVWLVLFWASCTYYNNIYIYIYKKVEVLSKLRSGDTKQTLRPDVQTNSV